MSTEELLPNSRQQIREVCGKSDKDILVDIGIIRDWLHTQPHLPEIPCDNMIEMFLTMNKYSIERTKEKLDMYYTIKVLIPDIYDHCHLRVPFMEHDNGGIYVTLPKQTKDFCRVSLMKVHGPPANFDVCRYFAYMLNLLEVRLLHDITLGEIFVVDQIDLKMGHALKMTPTSIKKITIILEKVFSNKMKGVHLINYPPFVDIIMTACKAAFKPKLFARIHLHNSVEDLYKYVPRDLLPVEYGGDQPSVNELNKMWRKYLRQHSDRFDELEKMRVNEELRPTSLDNDDILGYHGNFKKLDVD